MRLTTSRLGYVEQVEVNNDAVVFFPVGMPGFEHHHRFVLIEDPELAPVMWLQALDDQWVVFAVAEPAHLGILDYSFSLSDADASALDLDSVDDVRTLVILVLSSDPTKSSANLMAPVIVNTARRMARQLILDGGRYPLRYYPLADTAHDARSGMFTSVVSDPGSSSVIAALASTSGDSVLQPASR